jgi:hypothetical protein
MLGQTAERVLAGEIPHRDFDDPYTGGLAYLHALALKIFGVRVLSLRWLLLGATLAWVPVVYFLAARFVPAVAAMLVTAAAVAWSVPNYFASMPSYYNMFLATFGTAALFRHLEGGGRGWLAVAGLCGGLSFLMKSVGIFFVIAGGLSLLFRTQVESARNPNAGGRPSLGFLLIEAVGCLALIAASVRLLGERRTAMDLLHFVAPLAALVGVLLWSEWRDGRGALLARVRRAWALLGPFAAGAAAPVALFLVPYVITRSVADFSDGVFLSLERRFGHAERPLPPAADMVWALPYGAVLLAVALGRQLRWSSVAAGGAALGFLVALATIDRPASYLALWNSARFLPVFAILAGCALLLRRSSTLSPTIRQQAFLLLAGLAAIGLVQFPFGAPIYFCYTAPLLLVAVLPVVRLGAGRLHLAMLLGYVAFAVLSLNVGSVWNIGVVHQPGYPVVRVAQLERARLRIPQTDGYEYLSLVTTIRTLIPAGEYVYATPDCPEVYFLTGARNPTRDLYEFLGPSRLGVEGTLELIKRHGIRLVVINRRPHFSGPVDPALEAALESHLPHSAIVGRFVVRWRT